MWLGRGFFHAPLWRAEPMRNLPHAATARALVCFYALLGQDRLFDAEASAEIRALMGPSAFFNRLCRAVLERWPGARYAVAALSGTWRCEADVLAFGREADRCVEGGR